MEARGMATTKHIIRLRALFWEQLLRYATK